MPENRQFLETTKQYFKSHKDDTESRNCDLIFVVKKEGELRVIDGNGRTLKTITENKNSIHAFVGEPIAEPSLYEYWVLTSLLVNLIILEQKTNNISVAIQPKQWRV